MKIGDHVQIVQTLRKRIGEPASGIIVEINKIKGTVKVRMDWKTQNEIWFDMEEVYSLRYWGCQALVICIVVLIGVFWIWRLSASHNY